MIDVNEYSPKKRKFLREKGVSCLYVITTETMRPTKIGITADIFTRYKTIQSSIWIKLLVYETMWLPGFPVSSRLEQIAHERLASKNISGEWFDIDPVEAWDLLQKLRSEVYPTIEWRSHSETIDKLRQKLLDRKDFEAFSTVA